MKRLKTKNDPGALLFLFQTHKNEEDESSGNQEERGEKTDVAISFVFGQNIKDRAKVGCIHLRYT